MKNRRAFTMLELIVVVVIIGMLAVIATPSYLRAQQRTVERTIADNLDIIWQAVLGYRNQQSPAAFPPNLADVTAVNNTLGLYILDDGGTVAYYCQTIACPLNSPCYECEGVSNTYGWRLHVQERHEGERPQGYNSVPPTCNITAALHCPWITYPYGGDI